MKTELRDLIGHHAQVQADRAVWEVFRAFAKHHFEFMAVLEGKRLLGLCARRELGMLLGTQYGFSLFAQKPIREHLKPDPVCITTETPIGEVFHIVFTRDEKNFYDDVLLVDSAGEFLGLIFTHTLVKLQNRIHLENIHLLEAQQREISLKNEQIEADLRMSRELQQALLPDRYPSFPSRGDSDVSALLFHHRYHPYQLVGGDFFHVKRVSEMAAGIFIADVMGHGVRSALITAMLRALLEELDPRMTEPGDLLAAVNRELSCILRQAGNDTIYATGLYLVVDAGSDAIRYATAAHPLPFHLRRQAGTVEVLRHSAPGTILGVFEEAVFPTIETRVERGDSIILFTDGIVEVEDGQGLEFGVSRLMEQIDRIAASPTADILEKLILDARSFSATGEFSDDVCLVAVDVN